MGSSLKPSLFQKEVRFCSLHPLVSAVSNSGSVVRVAEAIQAARKHGAFALGITGKRESLLGQSVDKIMDLNIPPFEAAPGTRSYMISVMSLLLVAIRIGEVRGCYTMDEAMDMRFDMVAQGKALGELLPDMCRQVYDIAEKWKNMEAYDFVGTGFDYAAAWFGHAKVFEALGKYAINMPLTQFAPICLLCGYIMDMI